MSDKHDKGGRPPYRPTKKARLTVESMLALCRPRSEIAGALGIDQKTLAKHFRTELAGGAARATGRVIHGLVEAAAAGNASACRFILENLRYAAPAPKPAKPRARRPGKKEFADQQAIAAAPDKWKKLVN